MEVKVLMMRAKTARDALLQASKQLQVPLETLRAHLLEEGRRSFFRPRTNLYQITEKQVEPQTVEEMSEMAERHGLPAEPLSTDRTTGLIWVRDGQVSCSEDKYYLPFLSPCPGLDVRVNGKSINGPTIVSESDIVEVEPIFELVETTISVELSEDLMQAILEIRHGYKLFRSVKDQEPAQELILEVEESKIKNPPVTPELIYEHLARRGIVHGFDDQQIRTACQSQEDICCVIAQGTATIAGIDGEIELYVNKKHAQHAVLSRSDLALWKEIVSQYTVSPGEVIGVVVPPVPGKEGINVLGDVIPPTVGREVQIVAGHGVEVIGEPRKIVAIQAGRVEVEHLHENTYRLSIVQQYVHTGAVNLTTGPIRFKGDVFILGDVEEGMTVEAGGHLRITGQVSHAKLLTNGHLLVNGAVVGATLFCGRAGQIWGRMMPYLQAIREDLKLMIQVGKQLESNRSFSTKDIVNRGLQPMIKVLIDVKFKPFPARLRKLLQLVGEENLLLDQDFLQLLSYFEKVFLHNSPLVLAWSELEEKSEALDAAIEEGKRQSNRMVNVKVQSLTNSSLRASGSLEVEKFIYGSDIECGGELEVRGNLVGGQVQASDSIKAQEIGSSTGTKTVVSLLNEQGAIRADVIWTDTVVKIGAMVHKVLGEEQVTQVSKTDQGHLRIINGKGRENYVYNDYRTGRRAVEN